MTLTAKQLKIIENTHKMILETLSDTEAGHDYLHVYRVWRNARRIAVYEDVDLFTVELAALLHDIADAKFFDGNEEIGPLKAKEFLLSQNTHKQTIAHVIQIIKSISFKNSFDAVSFYSTELAVVQDADRLDAMGAIGIARAFNYGGYKNRPFYDPDIKPNLKMNKEMYKKGETPTINHFYEKLLLLKDLMNTATGKRMAEKLHDFMLVFLDQFFREWEGEI
jgi:uncharacterized protein